MTNYDSNLLAGPASFSATERHAALVVLMALSETIREVGSCPSGVLYAGLLGKISLPAYEAAISALKGAGLVSEASNMLTWIGPKLEERKTCRNCGQSPCRPTCVVMDPIGARS